MKVAIAGGHGQVALELTRMLADRGDEVRSLIRNRAHSADVEAAGGEPVIVDLEHDDDSAIARAVGDAEAVVFAAGAGPGSGPGRKESMDFGGALKLMAAARSAGSSRYVMVSAMGADPRAEDDGGMGTYSRAKGRADEALVNSGLPFTIVKPGLLTDHPATGTVTAAETVERGEIPRGDVAAVLAQVLHDPEMEGRMFQLVGGPTPITEALQDLTR